MAQAAQAEENDDDFGPPMPQPGPDPKPHTKKKRKAKTLANESNLLSQLPSASFYENSYMHRSNVSHVLFTPHTQFLVTASDDGHVKFWKKMPEGIEFVKHYKAHAGRVTSLAASSDGKSVVSTCASYIKFYDVLSFDLIGMIKTPADFKPSISTYVSNSTVLVASGTEFQTFSANSVSAIQKIKSRHVGALNILSLAFNFEFNAVISGDDVGRLEVWDLESATELYALKDRTQQRCSYKLKVKTDLYALAKTTVEKPNSITVSPNGKLFAVASSTGVIRLFDFMTCKIKRTYDESLVVFEDAFADGTLKMDAKEFEKRAAVERKNSLCPKVIFDASGNFIIFCTMVGIKVINVVTNKLVRVLGRMEDDLRFTSPALFQGVPVENSQYGGDKKKVKIMADNTSHTNASINFGDPMIVTTALGRNRFYCFTSREPKLGGTDNDEESRDILNEKPTEAELQKLSGTTSKSTVLPSRAVIHTTVGDIKLKLFSEECPLTVENFATHSKNGYYDGTIFHRCIKNFMIQAGDPKGDGTGGESIWGETFADEINRNLRHDRAYTLSMANAGPSTNGSQFFITTVPTPWLDGKHTVFGRVEVGVETVSNIEQTPTDDLDRPLSEISIINIDTF